MKKSIIFISISLVLIIMLGIGVSYSMWNISVSQETTNMAESKCFDLSISNQENSINLDNAYPISNDKGKSLTPYTFKVTNTCDITAEYSVNLEVLNNSTLSSKFIDIMFEGNINLLSSYDTTDKINTSSIESRKLTTGILKSRESKDYSLRLWIDYNTTLEDLNNEIKTFKSKIVVVGKPINYTGDTVFNFDYTGGEQKFVAPVSGTYRLETWGAQGGNNIKYGCYGGVGSYSMGNVFLKKSEILFINVGGNGLGNSLHENLNGGYNGGGSATVTTDTHEITATGGGATHIANKSGLLSSLENNKNNILIVSGGGGGGAGNSEIMCSNGGSGGGYVGQNGDTYTEYDTYKSVGYGGTQYEGGNYIATAATYPIFSTKGKFGQGGSSVYGGGGSGFYGGGSSISSNGGGSGYIGNSLLTNKAMCCYNCEESSEESTKTISTTCSEETPTSYCAKKGNGYARITLVSIDE